MVVLSLDGTQPCFLIEAEVYIHLQSVEYEGQQSLHGEGGRELPRSLFVVVLTGTCYTHSHHSLCQMDGGTTIIIEKHTAMHYLLFLCVFSCYVVDYYIILYVQVLLP